MSSVYKRDPGYMGVKAETIGFFIGGAQTTIEKIGDMDGIGLINCRMKEKLY